MTTTASERHRQKQAAAEAAAALVEAGQIVGLGSGSTATIAIRILGRRVAGGLRIVGIPSSAQTEHEARRAGIPLSTLAEHDRVDVTIDGADEVEIGSLNLLKGRGGARLGEQVVRAEPESPRRVCVPRNQPLGWAAGRGFVPGSSRRASS